MSVTRRGEGQIRQVPIGDPVRQLAPLEFESVADIPYLHRQRILVVTDEVADAARPLIDAQTDPQSHSLLDRMRRRGSRIADQTVAATVRSVHKMRAHNADVLLISRSEAGALEFRPSHPHPRTVYVAHPVRTTQYFDAAHFDQHLLEGKFAELLRLVTALGATTIKVQQIEGKASDSLIAAVGSGFGLETSARKRRRLFDRSVMEWEGTLPGHTKPHVPEGELAWFPTEQMWQHIAEARIKFRQEQFHFVIRHDRSMSAAANLKGALKAAELEAGGEIEEQETSAWSISGTFR